MMTAYQQMFRKAPKTTVPYPLEKGDHPGLNTSDLLGPDAIQKYQSLIGALKCVLSIGRLNITTAVMSMSSFRCAFMLDTWISLSAIMGIWLNSILWF